MKNIKHIIWFFKKYKYKYMIGIFALLFTNIVVIVPNQIIGKFIDSVTNNALTADLLRNIVLIFIAVIVLKYISAFIWHYYLFGHSYQSGKDFRDQFIIKILKQSPIFFFKNSTGSLMSKATQDIGAIETLTGYGILAAMDATVFPLIIIFIMGITISWPMTLLSVMFLPLLVLFTKILGKKLYEGFMRIQQSYDHISETVMENITSIRVIKGYSTQEVAQKRFDESVDKLYENTYKQYKVDAFFIPSSRLIPAFTFVAALLFGQYLMGENSLTLGQMTTFFLYLNMLVWPMFAFGDLFNVIQEASASIERLYHVYTYKEEVVDREDAIEYEANGDIEFKDFSFKYPRENQYALEDINLKIKKGETIGIVGKIGSGKTTLVRQLLRYYTVEEGIILMDDRPIEQYSIESIRDSFGYVPQQHLLFSKSVYDNIAFGKTNATEKEVMDAIEFSDFTKDLHTLPNGLETMIGEKGISISGGQKQRVSISRAVIKNPETLILDDSLSAVDAITEKNIIKNIREQRKGKTTIIIAHRLSGVKHADNIIVLDKGRIVESGTHKELLANKKWYYEQYEMQKLGGSDE